MIKGFWHIYMINHWFSIVTDQMRILLVSGLYDKCEEINIGCIGDNEQFKFLEENLIKLYPKLRIRYHSSRAEDYEFKTLQLIEQHKGDYIGFYFHTKGVTQPTNSECARWRAWLNEAILNRWETHVRNINIGADVSSVSHKLDPDHFSGNFYFFDREYIDELPDIKSLDQESRWNAEQWICMSRKIIFKDLTEDPSQNFHFINYLRS